MDPDIQQKIKYAKFKAADIIKAIKEGRNPIPGAPGEQMASSVEAPQDPKMIPQDMAMPSPLDPPLASPVFNPSNSLLPLDASSISQTLSFAQTVGETNPDSEKIERMDYKSLQQAQKHAKFAISALNYDDVKTALDQLRKAIEILEPFES